MTTAPQESRDAAVDRVLDAITDWRDTANSGQAAREEWAAVRAAVEQYGREQREPLEAFILDFICPGHFGTDAECIDDYCAVARAALERQRGAQP